MCRVLGSKPVVENDHTKLTVDGNKHTLVVSKCTMGDKGPVTVTATNAAGTATSTATLTVKGNIALLYRTCFFS